MKKFLKKIALVGLGLLAFCGIGLGIYHSTIAQNEPLVMAKAEGTEGEDTTTPIEMATVVIEKAQHGTITTNITSGNVGDICVVTAKHDVFYKIESVLMNGTALIESEEISGEYSFALVAGENKITATFVIDEELCGTFSTMIEEASNKDWTNLFSVENIIIIVKWVLDGGVLIALLRYYVKDKKLEKALENKVQETISEIIPDATKETVIANIEKVITPMFTQLTADNVETKKALSVFAKCMALSQENTAESRRAILDELSGLKVSDLSTIGDIKKYIEELVEKQKETYLETLKAIDQISESNRKIVESTSTSEKEAQVNEEKSYDGTTI